MPKLGSKGRPIIVKTNTDEKVKRITEICHENGWEYIIGLEAIEDITDLKKALKEKQTPADIYGPCPCGSGQKYKFCCAKKPFEMPL